MFQNSLKITPFDPKHTKVVGELISSIQSKEFNIPITLEEQPDLANIPNFYQKGKGNFWVAILEDRICGTIALLDIGNNQVALRKMFVDKDYRGSKYSIAHQLLSHAMTWATKVGVRSIYLGTTAQFLAAHRFYEKHGFAEITKENLPKDFPVLAVDSKFYMIEM